nr:hypothetical protein [Prevotella sp.]
MEKEINIAEILKDKPQGTKLYDWLYNVDVELDTISNTDTETVVWCTNKTDNNTTCHRGYSRIGTVRGCPDGLQILLPSKSMRDWSKLAWKIGDLLTNECGFQCIFKEWASDDYTKFNGCYSNSRDGYEDVLNTETAKFEKLDDNIAHDYIKEIERKLGGKLNLETLEIEKQPEFKDGDILSIQEDEEYYHTILIFKGGADVYVYFDCFHRVLIYGTKVDGNEKSIYHLATEEEKQQLFTALAKEGKAWDAEKKQIVDLKPKWTPKPFDRCIWKIRNCEGSIWQASFVSYVDKYGATPMGMSIDEDLVNLIILPYNEETAKLIGTTDDWKGDN